MFSKNINIFISSDIHSFFYLHVIYCRQNIQQKNIVITQKKTMTLKRSNKSLALTPLTRQVMTKSIQRAILEYQQHTITSPKSPLDLRVSTVMRRNSKCLQSVYSPESEHSDCLSMITNEENIQPSRINSKFGSLETVYEQIKGVNVELCDDQKCFQTEATDKLQSHDNQSSVVSLRESNELHGSRDLNESDIWYTPKEYPLITPNANIEVS